MNSKESDNFSNWPSGPIVSMPAPFEDVRGAIQTLVEGNIECVQIITSQSGTVRANHYHRSGSHYMYMIQGTLRYFHRPANDTSAPEWIYVKEGQMVFTPPMVEHAVEFVEDSSFLNISSAPRDQVAYEEDLVRVELYKPFTQ